MKNSKLDITLFTTERLLNTLKRLEEDFNTLNIVEDEPAYKVNVYYTNKIKEELKSRNV